MRWPVVLYARFHPMPTFILNEALTVANSVANSLVML